jgi:hypothetical protein
LDIRRTRSRDTVESFADEIKVMKDYRVLFLSFPFISEGFSVGFVDSKYQKLAKELKNEGIINEYEIDFKSVLDSFRNNKINIVYDTMKFSHPSYFEAFQDAISENGVTTKVGKILSNVLLKLADNKDAAGYVAKAVVNNFDKLPKNVRNELLLKLADNKDSASVIDSAVSTNFDKLPENVRNQVLLKLADNKEIAWSVFDRVENNFDKLPENVRNELLLKLAYGIDAYRNVAWRVASVAATVRNIVSHNFDKLPKDTINELLLKLAYSIDAFRNDAWAVSSVIGAVSEVVSNNYDNLKNVRNELQKTLRKYGYNLG